MAQAFENFNFVRIPAGTEDDPDTVAQYEHARIEGAYLLAQTGDERYTAMQPDQLAAWITAADGYADQTIDEVEAGHISPFVSPWTAVHALRVAARVLVNGAGTQEERDEAMRAIGEALVSVESPD